MQNHLIVIIVTKLLTFNYKLRKLSYQCLHMNNYNSSFSHKHFKTHFFMEMGEL